MISFYRSGMVAPGKMPQAIEFAKKISAFVKKSTGVDLTVGTPVGGNPNRIGWSASYEGLGAMEAAMSKLTSDPKYWDLINKNAELFVAGSIRDEIWRVL